MKKIITIIVITMTVLFSTTNFASASSLEDNLRLANANWHDPVTIKYDQESKTLTLTPSPTVSKLTIDIPDLNYESMNYYIGNSPSNIKIDVGSLRDGEHTVEVVAYDKHNARINSFANTQFSYSLTVGTSEFAEYGVKYDNLSILSSVAPDLYSTAQDAIKNIFTEFPNLMGTVDEIVIESNSYFTENPSASACTSNDSRLSISNSDGSCRLGATVKINPAALTSKEIMKNILYHEIVGHVETFALSSHDIGVDIRNCNLVQGSFAARNFQYHTFERDWRDEILMRNGYTFSDITSELREYATSEGEFFACAIGMAYSSPAPSKLSLITLDEMKKAVAAAYN